MKSTIHPLNTNKYSPVTTEPLTPNIIKPLTIIFTSIFLTACGGDLSETFTGSSGADEGTGGSGGSNFAPVATNVVITDDNGGDVEIGDVLSSSYTYTDGQGDSEGDSVFRWYRDGEVINGFLAINQSYTVDALDAGATLTLGITPVAAADTGGDGTNVLGTIVFSNEAPVGSPITTSNLASLKTVATDNDSVVDISHFHSLLSASVVDCTLSSGSTSKCHELKFSSDDNLTVTHYIPVIPTILDTPDVIEEEQAIGMSLDGVPIISSPKSATTDDNSQTLDSCGGHQDPSGHYHWHYIRESADIALKNAGITDASCNTAITLSATALSGYANDGYPIYSHLDDGGETATGLDSCNGHVGPTVDFPSGIYHYHASLAESPNLPTCLTGASVTTPVTPTFE